MPRLWSDTIDAHRRDVRDAVMDAAATLATERGLFAVTMAEIAERAGIGRATLYKYFPDVESVFHAWHEREISRHLGQLVHVRDRETTPEGRLRAVLEEYAWLSQAGRHHDDPHLTAALHHHEQLGWAEEQVRKLVRDLVSDAAVAGIARDDIPADELTTYCIHALGAARGASSKAAVRRLVNLTLDALRP